MTGYHRLGAEGKVGLAVYLGRRGGLFAPPTVYPCEPHGQAEVESATVADFDQDGKLDVAAQATGAGGGQAYRVVMLSGTGGGSLGPATDLYALSSAQLDAGLTILSMAAGDFTGDGRPDVVLRTFTYGSSKGGTE